jgi:hypothetical protein
MSGDRLSLAVRTMKARRSSTCPACRGPIMVGMSIAKIVAPTAWVHVRCVGVVRVALERNREIITKGADHR